MIIGRFLLQLLHTTQLTTQTGLVRFPLPIIIIIIA